jgi:uncharacterized OB-fold protein
LTMAVLPELTIDNLSFWTGGRDGRLMIAHCDSCDRAIHPPQPLCPACLGRSVSTRPALGSGVILARTINWQAWSPDLPVPYVLAIVELDGEYGVRITSRVVGCDPASVAIGDRVTVDFEHEGDVWIPVFRLR